MVKGTSVPAHSVKSRIARRLLWVCACLMALYLALCVGSYAAMVQPPDVFGQIVAKTPFPFLMVLPFETLWNRARGGRLKQRPRPLSAPYPRLVDVGYPTK